MEPKIVRVDKFMVAGLSYVGKNEHGEISEMWGELNRRWNEVQNVVERPAAAYGLCYMLEEGQLEYIAGLPVSSVRGRFIWIPDGLIVRSHALSNLPPSNPDENTRIAAKQFGSRQRYGPESLAAIQCFEAEISGGVSRHLSRPFAANLFGRRHHRFRLAPELNVGEAG